MRIKKIKRISLIFIFAFFFNAVWENLHSVLYVHYLHKPITESVLLHAALVDAGFITLITFPFVFIRRAQKHPWLIIPLGLAVAIGIERWALAIHRWAYTTQMPIIPHIFVGLTPTIQLALLGYLSFVLSKRMTRK